MQITKEAGVDEDVKPAAFVYEMVQVYEPEKQRINLEIFLFLFFFFFFSDNTLAKCQRVRRGGRVELCRESIRARRLCGDV